MKKSIYLFLLLSFLFSCQTTEKKDLIVSSDIDNFWTAFDAIKATQDSSLHAGILASEFLDKASPGQIKLMEVRNYTAKEYLNNIKAYPKFYESLKSNHQEIAKISSIINNSLDKFMEIYPLKKEGKIYLGIGNFRTNGTTVDSMVLFGTEMALSSKNLDLSEFPDSYNYFRNYIKEDPINNIGFLSCHEFVHTQQVEAIGTNLMSVALREGSAEFIAEIISKEASTSPALSFGKENTEAVMQQFKNEMFNLSTSYWVWTSRDNKFGQRDLGYFVGHELSRHYYENHKAKNQAIKDLIELDYSDTKAVAGFVDKTNYYKEDLDTLEKNYKANQPIVKSVKRQDNIYTVFFSIIIEALNMGHLARIMF